MNSTIFAPKNALETVDLSFDFSGMLEIGETLASGAVTAEVFAGEDASPSSLIDGAAVLDGTIVTQSVTAGISGVVYVLNCAVTTNTGQDLILQGLLAVTSNNPFQ